MVQMTRDRSSPEGMGSGFGLPARASPFLSDLKKQFASLRGDVMRAVEDLQQQGGPFPLRMRPMMEMSARAPNAPMALHLTGGPLERNRLPFAAIIPGDSAVEQVVTMGIYNFFNLYNTVLIVRLVLTWFPNPPQAIEAPLRTLCDPYLNLFRGIIPPLGGTLDFSPILAFLALNVFTNASAALPAEMPKGAASPAHPSRMLNPTPGRVAWHKRVMGRRAVRGGKAEEETKEA